MRRRPALALAFFTSFAAAAPACSQIAAPAGLDATAREAVVGALIRELDRAYVFPQVATTMGADLRLRLDRGDYNAMSDLVAFAAALTEHLQAISHDRHLRVRTAPPSTAPGSAAGTPATQPFGATERLAGDIAYIEITSFAFSADRVRDQVRDVMSAAADARALIIDVRKNGGGRPELVALISSYLFGDQPVHLNSLYWRPTNVTQEFFTDPNVEGKRFGPVKPVFVLSSSRTFSAAEEFTYNLQTRKRATIIGETTGGGAHPGGIVPLAHGLNAFIPSGRAINPVTGTNWEGTGVQPDVSVPADSALIVAQRISR